MNKKINVNLFFLILIILCLIVFIFPYFAFGQTSGSSPKRGEWLCWASNIKNKCGTYGWHKQKKVALKAAMDLCDKSCGVGCEADYCEKL